MEPRVFRRRDPVSVVFGFVFLLAGLGFFVGIISQLLSGKAIPITVNGNRIEEPAMGTQLLTACFPLLFVAFGGGFLLFCFRGRVEVSEAGIVAYGLRNKPTFDAAWDDILGYKIGFGEEGGETIELETTSSRLVLLSNLERWTELRDLLDRRLTHLSLGAKYRILHSESVSPPSGP